MHFKIIAWNLLFILDKLPKCSFIGVPIVLRNNPQKHTVFDLRTRKPALLTCYLVAVVLRVLKATFSFSMLWELR